MQLNLALFGFESFMDLLNHNVLFFKNWFKLGHKFNIEHFDLNFIWTTGRSICCVVAKLKEDCSWKRNSGTEITS